MTDAPREPAARKPLLLDLDATPDPANAPPVPDLGAGRAILAAGQVARVPPSRLGRWAFAAFSALFGFVLSVAAYRFIEGLMVSSPLLGMIALVLTVIALAFALLLALREGAAFWRLARLDHLHQSAVAVRVSQDIKQARGVVQGVATLYRTRPEMRWQLARLNDRQGEVMDADALLDLAETELLVPLDLAARAEVERAARQVAIVTALVPLALADVATALFSNLRMIRRIAEIYGGRAGTFGSLGLLRKVFTALVATGAVALTDDLLGSVAGGGVLSKLSRRFGEGVVNGALTARVGVAAMEVCRPLPFHAAPRPSVTALTSRALSGLFGRDKASTNQAPDEIGNS